MTDRDNYKAVASLALGAVSASLVLLPSVLGVVAKPLSGTWAVWTYLIFGLIALVTMTFVYYVAAFTNWKLPIRTSGVGAITACLSILSFGAFLFINLFSDQTAPPEITSLVASNNTAAPGEVVSLTAHGEDQNGDRLHWVWRVTPDPKLKKSQPIVLPGHLESAVWRVADAAEVGTYTVSAVVSDGHRKSEPETLIVEVRKKP